MLSKEMTQLLINGVGETLLMTLLSTLFGYIIGLPMGIGLVITSNDGIAPNKIIYKILDFVSNILRSVPFLILLILLIPFTRMVVGKSYGTAATIVPLACAAFPYIARLVESSLREVDYGVVEAAKSMGASNFQIVLKVLIPEAKTSLIAGATIALGTILGYSAMAGTVGGGGLGNIAIQYGYYRYNTVIMWITVILLVVLVQILQQAGTFIAKKTDKRIR